MYKHLFRTVLGTVGILVMLSLGVVNAQETCGSGYVLNAAGTGCELVKVTFDAYGGSFSDDETIKIVEPNVIEVPPIRYSHTANINDDGVASSVYANNLSTNDVVTIPGATSLDIEVRFTTESASYDWLAIYPAGITPTASNYSSASISSGKLAGHGSYSSYTKPSDTDATYHRNFTVDGDTAQFYFKSDNSTAYYGYYAIISGIDAGNSYECEYYITPPTKEGYIFGGWYTDTGYTQIFDTSECLSSNTTVYAKWYQPQPKDILIEARATSANQKITINKYFENDYTVYRGDGNFENLESNTTHTYTTAGTYIITLSTTADRWTFRRDSKPLVPIGTTMTGVRITSMPSLADGFGANATTPGNYFFMYFNSNGAITSLPEGSFRLSTGLTVVGSDFFHSFNEGGQLTNLPEGSFDTSNITTVGNYFFSYFNFNGKLTSLPEGSFRLSTGVTTVGDYFFYDFNYSGALTSLPEGSFKTDNITTVGNYFFGDFNNNGALTSLPEGSFDTSNITTMRGSFFYYFNCRGKLTSLPEGSFRLSTGVTTVGDYFFYGFNYSGALTSLPEGSFKTDNITTVGNGFFSTFNYQGQLTSLPEGSFDTSNITTVRDSFFYDFNYSGALTSLPEGSFNISNVSGTVGYSFFNYFNGDGGITSLPEGSFDTSKITSVGYRFFEGFNSNGSLTSLPEGSFDTSNIKKTQFNFFSNFNNYGKITNLPTGSFKTDNITTAGNGFFKDFNSNGAITNLPEGSFNISNIDSFDSYGTSIAPGTDFFKSFNYNGCITSLPDSFKLNSVVYNKANAYQNAFNSPSYTLNRKVSDLVTGITVLTGDMDTFSDNQPGRCGVHENWLVTTADACNILYDANGGTGTTTGGYMSNATGVEVGSGITLPTREGYTFSGWLDVSGNIVDEVMFPDMDGQTLYANWEAIVYTITIDVDGVITTITGEYGSPITPPANPTKNGYTFKGWEPEIPATMPAEDLDIKATWDRNGSSGGGGGGGGGGGSSSSNTGSATSQTGSQIDSNTGSTASGTNEKEPEGTGNNAEIQTGSQVDSQPDEETLEQLPQNVDKDIQDSPSQGGQQYSEEFQKAYEFAKGRGITTMPTIQKANMNGPLTRIAMAKMLSQYAINVLGQKAENTVVPKFNDVTDKQNSDYDNGVTLAYQLGIMGQNMPNNNFRPTDEVTRAEFATALSRMLYNTPDGEYKSTSKYYTHHMEKLKEEGIITKDDPAMKELRGYVMIMLMRSAK